MDLASAILGGVSLINDIANPQQAAEKRHLAEDQITLQREQVAADKAKAEAQTKQTMYLVGGAAVVCIGAIAFFALK
jgi:hypothetical protein